MDGLGKYIVCMVFIFSLEIGGDCKRAQILENKKDCITPDDLPGQIIPIKNCQTLIFLLQNEVQDPSIATLLNDSMCRYGERFPHLPEVCCPLDNEPTTTTTETSQTTTTSKPISTNLLEKLTDQNECGRSNSTHIRIAGGIPAELGAWPWMAALGFRHTHYTNSATLWSCGGSLISDKYVLTAAHCTYDFGMYYLAVVRLGELNLDPNVKDGAEPIDIVILNIIRHELYDKQLLDYDIALLRLETSVKFNQLIRPICLPLSQEHRAKIIVNSQPFVAGWGFNPTAIKSEALMEVQVPIVDNSVCKNKYASQNIIVDEKHLCAGKTGKDACRGDSGGPLMLPIVSQYYLVGIVNFGPKNCNASDYPGVYGRVTSFLEWIANNTK